MRIEEYLGTLPAGMLSGADAELSQRSLREMFRLAGLGAGDTVYHLGCGRSAEGIRVALAEFGARRAVGIDSDASKLRDARDALEGAVQGGGGLRTKRQACATGTGSSARTYATRTCQTRPWYCSGSQTTRTSSMQ